MLIEADGQVVEREVFFRRLWPGASVNESNLSQAIARLRKELGDAGDIIETVPRRGYRLMVRPERAIGDASQGSPPVAATGGRSAPRSWLKAVSIVAAGIALSLAIAFFVWPSSHREAVDTSTPIGKVMFIVIAAMAELERSVIRERVIAGIEFAGQRGTKSGNAVGRPKVIFRRDRAVELRRGGMSWREIAKELGVEADDAEPKQQRHGPSLGSVILSGTIVRFIRGEIIPRK